MINPTYDLCQGLCVNIFTSSDLIYTFFLQPFIFIDLLLSKQAPQQHILVTNVLIYDEGHCRI